MRNLTNSASEAQTIELFNSVKFPIIGAGGGFAPIGTINFFDASIAPQGWLACDGQTYNIADYLELATYYASVHGASNFYGGDGTTTFAVPDLRGEFLRGTGTNSHENQGSGANVGVHQDGTEHCNIGMTTDDCTMYGAYSGNSEETADSLIGSHTTRYMANGATTQSMHPQFYTSRPTNTSFLICVKATLSDAHLDSYQIYSPNERKVGWWQEEIDGILKKKPMYAKTIKTENISDDAEICSVNGLYHISVIRAEIPDNPNWGFVSVYYASSTDFLRYYIDKSSDKLCISIGSTHPRGTLYTTIQYTKNSDSWEVAE